MSEITSTIDEAIETQKARLMRSEVEVLNNSLKKTNALLASNMQNGRSVQGRLSAKLALESHLMLRGQAQALQTRITGLAQGSPRAAAILAEIPLHPTLLAPPPVGLTYKANRTADIVFRLHSGAGTLAQPRAPPIIIDASNHVLRNSIPARLPEPTTVGVLPSKSVSAMSDFDRLYNGREAESFSELVRDIRKAPGGVIVDVVLDEQLIKRITDIAFDKKLGKLRVKIGNSWRNVYPSPTAPIARAALAFAADGRVAAIDLRSPPSSESKKALITATIPCVFERLNAQTSVQEKEIQAELNHLTVVNLHPSLVDTSIGQELIGADELIFQALQTGPIFRASESRYRGINVEDLRQVLDDDLTANGLGHTSGNLKSILSVSGSGLNLNRDKLDLAFSLRFDVYFLYGDSSPVQLHCVSNWFKQHEAKLIAASPQLQQLLSFSAAVAVFRSAVDKGITIGLLPLAMETEDSVTPRFLCRSKVENDCLLPRLHDLMMPSTNQYCPDFLLNNN